MNAKHYYTVLVPYSNNPTAWHPTEKEGPLSVLSRGAFQTRDEAVSWATRNLNGQRYVISRKFTVFGDPIIEQTFGA